MSVVSLAPYTSKATSKAPMSYLDLLPDDVLDLIHQMVVADTTAEVEAQIVALEARISSISFNHFAGFHNFTRQMQRMLTLHYDNNHPTHTHSVYDGFLHINPKINLYRTIKAERIQVNIWNRWEVGRYTQEQLHAGLLPHGQDYVRLDITEESHGNEPRTTFMLIDEVMRQVLGRGYTLHNSGWDHNCIQSITTDFVGDDDEDDEDDDEDDDEAEGYNRYQRRVNRNNTDYTVSDEDGGFVRVFINIGTNLHFGTNWSAVTYDRTHEYSTVTLFEDEE
jgi:hypothetical protein